MALSSVISWNGAAAARSRSPEIGCGNWISGKSAAGSFNNFLGGRKAAAGSLNNVLGGRFSTVCVSDDYSAKLNHQSSLPSSKISPWLMLPPTFEGGNKMVYNLYSLGENKVVSLNKRSGKEKEDLPDDDARIVGSSHGWLALLNKRNNSDLFLSNPLTRRHIKLPPLETLHIPKHNLTGCSGVVEFMISSSPDEEDCRAMLTYSPVERLAFCCPGRSTGWTPIGAPSGRGCDSFVYSRRQNLFFCLSANGEFEAWDLRDPLSPRLTPIVVTSEEDVKNCPWDEELFVKIECMILEILVVAEHSGEIFMVRRYVLERIGPDGSYVEDNSESGMGFYDSVPYKTVSFDVLKYDQDEKALKYMDGSLDGLAFFIGSNHGFALSASEFPGLNPNSIYYTDFQSNLSWTDRDVYGGHDIGIFNYVNRTFSPCYYPCDVKSIRKIMPPPMWFTPSQPSFWKQ